MPDIVVHNAMGAQVLPRLDPALRNRIDPELFRVGVMGPDPYIYYRFLIPFLRRGVNRRSTAMHHTKVADFLVELAGRSGRDEAFSFLAGFLCHYAMDAAAHPWINLLAGPHSEMHTAIERRLDALELARQGKQRRDLMRLFPPAPKLPELGAALSAVYGWKKDRFRAAWRYARLYHWVVKDQHGLLQRLLGRRRGRAAAISVRTKLADGLDLEPIAALQARAVERGAELITAADRFRHGALDEEALRRLIGGKSYAGVVEE